MDRKYKRVWVGRWVGGGRQVSHREPQWSPTTRQTFDFVDSWTENIKGFGWESALVGRAGESRGPQRNPTTEIQARIAIAKHTDLHRSGYLELQKRPPQTTKEGFLPQSKP